MFSNLTIIIVTYNAMPWLHKCLGSIDFKKYNVIIVDNNSKDDTVSIIKSKYPKAKLFQQSNNLGFGQANNKGIKYALEQGVEHIFLLNQDAYLVDNCIDALVAFQHKNPEYGILSPIHINNEQTCLDKGFANYVRFELNAYFYSDHVIGNTLKPVYQVPYVNAAGWLISKKCLTNVGGFDPIFFHYGEDDNYCQRANYHKFKVGVMSNVFMIHDRENRSKPYIEDFSEQYFDKKERSFKVRFANINVDFEIVNQSKKKYKKKIIKEWLKGNFTLAKGLQKELNILKNALPAIKSSRTINKVKGLHYIN